MCMSIWIKYVIINFFCYLCLVDCFSYIFSFFYACGDHYDQPKLLFIIEKFSFSWQSVYSPVDMTYIARL